MKVIGLTDGLREDAEKHCAAGFRAWLRQAKNGTWGSWEELKIDHPGISRMSEDEAHFPLTLDGTGVRAQVFFPNRLLMLRCIAPSPVMSRLSRYQPLSLNPAIQKNTN